MRLEQIAKHRKDFEALMTGKRFRMPLDDMRIDPETECYENHQVQLYWVVFMSARGVI